MAADCLCGHQHVDGEPCEFPGCGCTLFEPTFDLDAEAWKDAKCTQAKGGFGMHPNLDHPYPIRIH